MRDAAMKYCLFCRESFEDEMWTCPYCGDELLDDLPEEGDADESYASHGEGARQEEPEEEGVPPVVQVAIVTSQEDLEAAVAVLKETNIYFEIEDADRRSAEAGIIPARAWRLLVAEEAAHDAFLRLISAIPRAFPREVAEKADQGNDEEDETVAEASVLIEDILSSPGDQMDEVALARQVIAVFSSEAAVIIARAKIMLSRAGEDVAEMLVRIAAEAAATGGERAESVLFHSMQVLEAMGVPRGAREAMERLYDSPVEQVRSRAAYGAGRLGDPAAVERLLDMLEDRSEQVRYEASESIWRLTGFDFDFEPSAPVEEERENIMKLREMWKGARGSASVRGRVTLRGLLGGFREDID